MEDQKTPARQQGRQPVQGLRDRHLQTTARSQVAVTDREVPHRRFALFAGMEARCGRQGTTALPATDGCDRTEDPQASRGGREVVRPPRGAAVCPQVEPPDGSRGQEVPRHRRVIRPGRPRLTNRGHRFPTLGASPTDSGRVSAATDTSGRDARLRVLFRRSSTRDADRLAESNKWRTLSIFSDPARISSPLWVRPRH